MTDIYEKLGLNPADLSVPELEPCTPAEALAIREEFGLLLPDEQRAKAIGRRGPPRKPTLADYNEMLAEDGKEPMTPEAYAKIMGRGEAT